VGFKGQAQNVVRQILSTGTSAYRTAPFKNLESRLPVMDMSTFRTIQYIEHDIRVVTDPKLRGLERIVTGTDGSIWYTADHYLTFIRIK
jgi:ribonuclease T1